MRILPMLRTAAVVTALTFAAAPSALAQDDDDETCDNIMDELKKLTERVMGASEPKAVGPTCAATGQLLGIIKASREVAAECYDEGKKRDRIVGIFDKTAREIESKVNELCK
ncbi:MAG: hypothetical protein JO000_08750 [Alphaproteobacteria bacterium]|nr:hypothetical protein [Alphaproteobacteria bacterium]